MDNKETNTPSRHTPTIRSLFQAQKRVFEIDGDRLTALEDKLASIEAMFEHKDGSPRTVNENIGSLRHQLDMKTGEIMALWRQLDKLEGGIAAIHNLIARRRGHAASDNQPRSDMNGASPFEDLQ